MTSGAVGPAVGARFKGTNQGCLARPWCARRLPGKVGPTLGLAGTRAARRFRWARIGVMMV